MLCEKGYDNENYFIEIDEVTGEVTVRSGDPKLFCNKHCNTCRRIYCG